jgi:response regulator of citrate/malate metabolism|tara:strand:+ start:341 stop:706 length:366 start_codon:yes stop_codon:yes gene_type:complete
MRVLAFEDSYDIEALLKAGNVDTSQITIEQKWNSKDAVAVINDFSPDILLLDQFMPPFKGLEVLRMVNDAVGAEELNRPDQIIGISSAGFANRAMLNDGADHAILKFNLANLNIWPKNNDE